MSDQPGIDRSKFGQRTSHAPDSAGHAEHLVADTELVDLRPDRLHHPGHVDAENCRWSHLCVSGLASADLDVERVYTACHDAHQNFVGAGGRVGDLADL